ncbi:MAG: tRNA (5-methylaminomethyl-2-thiouridine)(34)-methyltransferase MnmD [Flammeovirgaceae bacterium]
MNQLRIIVTHDGSHSLFYSTINETYHSIHGALQESKHVFIRNGVEHLIKNRVLPSLSIFEVGFGTGLNALLVAEFAEKHRITIDYCALELFPLPWETIAQLNYAQLLAWHTAPALFEKIHECDWGNTHRITEFFSLRKEKASIHDYLISKKYDCVFFDAFAPEKQPEMWTLEVLRKVTDALSHDGVLVTYCAKGQLRRDLVSLNFKVEKLPGPPGKREMTRALRDFN